MNSFELDYKDLLSKVLNTGILRSSRAGDTVALFGQTLTISDMRRGLFPIVTSRQVYFLPVMAELYCFLKGTDKLQDFIDAGCNYWTDNAKAWEPNQLLQVEHMTVGPIYGVQWRKWFKNDWIQIDQLEQLVTSIRHNPYGRRHVVTAWRPDELEDMCLPPCHIMFQCCVAHDRISMIVYMRSVDLCLGLPSDIVLYAALLQLICNETNYMPGDLTFMLGDAHIYTNHTDLLALQLHRDIHALPHYGLKSTLETFKPSNLVLYEYRHNAPIRYPLNI